MGMHIAHGVEQFGHLFLAGLDHRWISMACGGDTKGCGQVQVLLAFSIPNMDTVRALPHDWPGSIAFAIGDVARFIITQQLQNLAACHGASWLWFKPLFALGPKSPYASAL